MSGLKASCQELVSVIVVNRNRRELLKQCLDSILNQSYKNLEVIVVDNASNDGSVEMVKEKFSDVKIIISNRNLYFCEGYNLGISQANGRYILCLNNDVVLDPDFLFHSIKGFQINNRIGMVSGKIINPITDTIDSTGQFLSWFRKAIERGYRKDKSKNWPQDYIWGCSGACVVYKKKMLEDVKSDKDEYFDSSYRAYLEDFDLNWRANKLGWRAYYIPKAIAYHYRGKTGWVNRYAFGYLNLPPEFKIQFIRNRYATILKNEKLTSFILHLPFILVYDIYLWFFLSITGCRYIIKFLKDWKWIKQAITKRKVIAGKIKEYRNGKSYYS